MVKYPLAPLISVREHKENLAQQAVAKAERALTEAREELKKKEEECKVYEEWCHQEINRLYNDILGQNIYLKELDEIKLKVIIFLEKIEEKYKEVEQAKEVVEVCIRNKEKALFDLSEARKQTMKLNKHKERWEEEQKKILEIKEELELEDFTPRSKEEEVEYSDEYINME